MTTPLRLAIEITARAAGLVSAAGEARAAVASVGAAAGDAAGVEARAAELRAVKLAQLRASIVPLAAAQRDYLSALAQIRVAEEAGAISANERAAAVTRLKEAFTGRVNAISGRSEASAAAAAEAAAAEASSRRQAQALDDLRARYSPLYAAQRQYLATLAEIRQAQAAGALSAAESAAAISRTKEGFAAQVTALRGASAAIGAHGAAMKLNGAQAAQLSYQLNDVVVSLASGQNPLMVLIQQGSQITPIFGGVGNTFRALMSVLTPMRLAIGGVAGAVALGAKAWLDYDASARSVATALAGVGRYSGMTRQSLEGQVEQIAAPAGLSRTDARSIQAAALMTGRLGGRDMAGIIAMAKDFAATIGTSSEEAGAKLAEIFADPAKGARTLTDQYRLLDGATRRYVDTLVDQNRLEEARAVLIDRLPARLAKAAEATNGWARLQAQVGRWASDQWNDIGQAIDGGINGRAETRAGIQRELELARGDFGLRMPMGSVENTNAQANVARLEARIAALDEDLRRAEQMRFADGAAERGGRSLAVARDLPSSRDASAIRALEARLVALRAGEGAPGLSAAERADIGAGIQAITRAIDTYIPAAQRQAEISRIDIALMQERNPLRRADLVAERERVALMGEVTAAGEVETRAEQARARALAETGIAARDVLRGQADQVTMARAEAAAIGLGDGARRRALAALEAEQEIYRQGLIGAAAQAYRDQAAALADLAIARERAEAVRDVTRDQDDRLATLRAEIGLIGQSEAARRRALAVLAMEQDLRRRDIDPASGAGRELTARAGMIADIESSAERYQAAWERMRDGAGSAIDGLVDRIAEGRVSMKDFGDWGREVFADLTKTFLQFAVSNPLKNALLGGNLPTLSDAGGVLGQLFGAATSATPALADVAGRAVGTMTVTAGTVMLTGGLGAIAGAGNGGNGLAGLLGAAGGGGTGGMRPGASTVNDRVASAFGLFGGGTGVGGDSLRVLRSAARVPDEALTRLQPDMQQAVASLVSDVQQRFGAASISITSGFRSIERQAELWQQALQKYGDPEIADDWVARPGSSQHNYGRAVDLRYASPEVMDYARGRAGAHGLHFPLGNENWHAELAGSRDGGMNALTQQAGASAAALRQVATSGDGAQSALADIARQASGAGPTGGAGLPAGGGEAGGQIAGQMGAVSIQAQTVSVYGAGGMGAGGEATGAGGTATGQAGPLGMLGRLGDTIGGMVRSVAGMIGSLMSSVMSALSSIGGGLFSGIGGLFSGLFSWIGGLFGGGFADGGAVGGGIGGLITGPGGPRDDAISTRLPVGSFIVNAASTARHRDLLDALAGAGAGNDNGGSIAARVSAGEYYLPPHVVARHRGLVEAINAGRLAPTPAPVFASGGIVGPVARLPRFADGGVVAGGGAGGPTPSTRAIAVNLVNNGEPMRATARQSREGDVDLIEIVLDRVGGAMASGRYDEAMGRYGGSPMARPR